MDAVDCGAGEVSCVGMGLTWMFMDWVLIWMTVWVCEWRLLESGFRGLWGICRIGTMLEHRSIDSRLRGNDGMK